MSDRNDLDRRRSLLATALVGALLPKDVPEGHMLRAWLDSWSGIGHVVEEIHEVGYNVRLDRSPFVWWAEFRCDQIGPLPRGSQGPGTSSPRRPSSGLPWRRWGRR